MGPDLVTGGRKEKMEKMKLRVCTEKCSFCSNDAVDALLRAFAVTRYARMIAFNLDLMLD